MSESKSYYSKKRVKKSFIHYLAGKGISSIAAFSVAIILVREMQISDFAGYIVLSGLVSVMIVITNMGMERIIPKYFSEFRQVDAQYELFHLNRSLLVFKAFALFFIAAFFLLFSVPILQWFSIPYSVSLVVAFVCYVFLYGISKYLIVSLQALLLQKEATIGLSIEWISKLLIILFVLFSYGELNLLFVTIVQVIALFFGVMYMFFSLSRNLIFCELSEGSIKDKVVDKELIEYGLHNYAQTLAGFHTAPPVNKLLAGALLAGPSVAALGFAYSLLGAIQRYLPANLFLGLIEPMLMAKYSTSKDFKQTSLISGLLLKINMFVLIPATLWVLICSSPLLLAITKGKYHESNLILSTLLLILILESHRGVLQLICNTVGQSSLLLRSNLWSLCFFPFVLLLTHHYLLPGLLFSIIFISFFRVVYLTVQLSLASYKIRTDWVAIFKMVVLSCFVIFITNYISLILFEVPTLISSLISLLFSVMVYLFLAFFLKPFLRNEREVLNGFVGKKVFVW